jgi:hypothetical protein
MEKRMRRFLALETMGLVTFVAGCGGDSASSPDSAVRSPAEWAALLSEAEVFVWDDQPIEFSPPPVDWVSEREQSGGLMGVRYVKQKSVGERIHVAEYTSVGKKDRCKELEDLMRELDDLNAREFAQRLQRARPYAQHPLNASETEGAERANERLDDARTAHRSGDLDEVRDRVSAAIWDLHWVDYSLDDVVEPAIFTGKGYEQFGKIEVFEPVPGEVAGEPSISLDYSFVAHDSGRTYHGREVYVEHNNRLFVASFQGLQENLPLFDALVATIQFPAGSCEH